MYLVQNALHDYADGDRLAPSSTCTRLLLVDHEKKLMPSETGLFVPREDQSGGLENEPDAICRPLDVEGATMWIHGADVGIVVPSKPCTGVQRIVAKVIDRCGPSEVIFACDGLNEMTIHHRLLVAIAACVDHVIVGADRRPVGAPRRISTSTTALAEAA